ncbi:DUF6483 family protein [Paenibacillus sp. UMB4589-SE434]|uniref:DUF6483 family protein n=1 Tax=Paenibacillus sp. UMB4589-SE434 TaxID=3046314 RepID=UPI00254F914E|nr:DUF6483 family protein [Paenibacillus sp. UMB4589-SE434]MDK8183173.1 DUF6483 family protein [Paenibacillus sp. UMB4589-SE434]
MYQRDYLVRLIQEMTAMIARTLGLKEQKEKAELLLEWDDLLERKFRLNGKLTDTLSPDDIIKLFHRHGHLQSDELQALAIIMLERAELEYELQQSSPSHDGLETADANHIQRLMKVYVLLVEAMLHGSNRSLLPVMDVVEKLSDKLAPYHLDASLLERIWRWHDLDQRYAEAENVLYEWMTGDEARLSLAAAWYERLLELPDDELEAGGLPRDEVEQGLQDVQTMMKVDRSNESEYADHT